MTSQEKENFTGLLNRFMEDKAAREAARDIEKGDELLESFPAPLPDEKALSQIKTKIALTLKSRQTAYVFRQRIWLSAGVAAMLAIGAFLTLRYGQGPSTRPAQVQIASAVWDGSDDADISILREEVQTVQNTLAGVQVTDNTNTASNTAENDLEMELIEVGSDIWKG
jgi:hypothetical protein